MSGWSAPPRGTAPICGELHVVRASLEGASHADAGRTLRRVLSHMLGAQATGTAPERLLAGRVRPVGAGLWCGAVRSRDTLLTVFSRHADVGVDLQSGSVLYDESLHLALTRWEQDLLRRLSLSSRHAFFLALWARKEAVLRAAGHGLRIRQSEVGVLIEEGAGTVPVPLPFDGGIMEVHLRDLPVEGGRAAVASATPFTALYTWDFDRPW